MTAHARVVGGGRISILAKTISPFDPNGTIANEDSRAAYTTVGLTACTKIAAHAGGVNDGYHKLLMIVPNTVDMGAPTPTVFVLHGVGNDETIIMPSGGVGGNGMTDAWLDQGWIVVSATQGGVSWGNESARLGMLAIWSWFVAIFACNGFMVYGVSMGGCAALNFLLDAKATPVPVLACALNSGATNFQYVYDNNSTLRPAMRTAYGLGAVLSSDSTYVAAVDTADGGHDPQKQTAAEFPTIPFRFYASAGDVTVDKTNDTDLFNAKLTAASWVPEHIVVTFSGAHVAAASYQPADCVSFFQRALP